MRLASLAAAVVASIILFSPAPAAAQYRGPDTAAQRAAMERLAPLMGRWQGEANVFAPSNMIVEQTELVEPALDGLLLLIRGTGHAATGESARPVFQAMAVISYDTRRNQYDVRAYTHEGHATTATGVFLDDGSFRWSFAPGGPVQVRFTIAFDQTTWRELGEISMDNGATWTRTVDLNLRRVH